MKKIKLEKIMREDLIKRANKAYEKLQNDPQAWQEELEERADWEATIADGLDDDTYDQLQDL